MKIKQYLKEEVWMPNELNPKISKEVSKISRLVDYDLEAAAAFAISLLEDVNFHDAAAVLNKYVVRKFNL